MVFLKIAFIVVCFCKAQKYWVHCLGHLKIKVLLKKPIYSKVFCKNSKMLSGFDANCTMSVAVKHATYTDNNWTLENFNQK